MSPAFRSGSGSRPPPGSEGGWGRGPGGEANRHKMFKGPARKPEPDPREAIVRKSARSSQVRLACYLAPCPLACILARIVAMSQPVSEARVCGLLLVARSAARGGIRAACATAVARPGMAQDVAALEVLAVGGLLEHQVLGEMRRVVAHVQPRDEDVLAPPGAQVGDLAAGRAARRARTTPSLRSSSWTADRRRTGRTSPCPRRTRGRRRACPPSSPAGRTWPCRSRRTRP